MDKSTDFSKLSDEDLMRAVKLLDNVAFSALVCRHISSAWSIAVSLLGPDGESEEVVQEAFVRVWERGGQWDEKKPFWPWFFSILHNQIYDVYRRHSRNHKVLNAIRNPVEFLEASGRQSDSPADILAAQEQMDVIEHCIDGLPETLREIMKLRLFFERSYAEIAEGLKIPFIKVKHSIEYGLKLLRKCLNNALETEEEEKGVVEDPQRGADG